ncbi:MAG: hypothetical protein ACP5HQ_00360 [Thermoprotei archaeon]
MDVVVGGGVVGLTVAKRVKAKLIEEKSELGGVHSPVDLGLAKVPGFPVFSDAVCGGFSFKEFRPNVVYEREHYLDERVCRGVCPNWLTLEGIKYVVFPAFEHYDWLRARAKRVVGNKVVTSSGATLEFENLYVAAPPPELGMAWKGDYVSVAQIIAIIKEWKRPWDALISGDTSRLFTRVLRMPTGDHHVLYVETYFHGLPPSWDRVKSDVKRALNIDLDRESLTERYRVTKYALLVEGTLREGNLPENVKVCGRFMRWNNPSFCESIRLALEC